MAMRLEVEFERCAILSPSILLSQTIENEAEMKKKKKKGQSQEYIWDSPIRN
jgi:hypothetical protein